MNKIIVQGARTHNLKNIDLQLPRDQLVVITGLSGSGKSSLAFDTLYAEGQRRYVESLSTYARQFLSLMEKPDVDHIEGLSPAISIEQKSTSHNPRSTVGTITEIYDYLRLLFARVGTPYCPVHNEPLEAQTVSEMVDQIMERPKGSKVMMLAPIVQDRKGEHLQVFQELKAEGFVRVRINGTVTDLDDLPTLHKNKKHTIEVVVDRFKVREDIEIRLAESIETALRLSDGLVIAADMESADNDTLFSARFSCPICGHSLPELEPRLFSFNSPAGACSSCDGLGMKQFFDPEKIITDPKLSLSEGAISGWDKSSPYYYQTITSLANHYQFDIDQPFRELSEEIKKLLLYGSGEEKICFRYRSDSGGNHEKTQPFEGIIPNRERRYRDTDSDAAREHLKQFVSYSECSDCQGSRLNQDARNVRIGAQNISDITEMAVRDCHEYFSELTLTGQKGEIAGKIIKEISERLQFLVDLGLDYLNLSRSANTLSGGETQRIRLASQIGAGLVGVMYILDEPSIGLHQRDNERLLNTLTRLRDLGNSVIVVEHDEDAIRAANYIVDIGPGAGVHGGQIVAQGSLDDILQCQDSVTGQFLSGERKIAVPETLKPNDPEKQLVLSGARGNNLKNVHLSIPLGLLTCITGVSGSGKSTLIYGTLYPLAASRLNKAQNLSPCDYDEIEGLEQLDKVIDIDQSPIGRTPRSNPATYTGIFTTVRELFAQTPEARLRGYKAGRFSYNVKGGRCEACQGDGLIKVEMHFLPDIYVPCDTCKGKRYNRETLDIKYKAKTIHDVLELTIEEGRAFFDAVPAIARKLQTLLDVGLSYIKLGQSATTLSGGEAQRIKLARELSKRDTGKTLYILDEPTTGLHFHDIQQLLTVLHRLRDDGNTVVVIEHNLDVIKTADWIVDLGPEGGEGGGNILVDGQPARICEATQSHTGRFLKPLLEKVKTAN